MTIQTTTAQPLRLEVTMYDSCAAPGPALPRARPSCVSFFLDLLLLASKRPPRYWLGVTAPVSWVPMEAKALPIEVETLFMLMTAPRAINAATKAYSIRS